MFCYQKNFSNPTLPVDEAQFYALVRAKQWNENIDKYRETGEASLKRKLPAFIFQATFDETESKAGKLGAWRKQSATRLTGLVVMDIDHVENPREVFESWRLATGDKADRTRKDDILLVYVTPSGKGLKVVFKADANIGNLIDNQYVMARELGNVTIDECCKDSSRMSYVCKESDILYLDKELFTYENKAFSERYTALYRDGHSQATKEDETVISQTPPVVDERNASLSFKGVPYEEIIAEWWRQNGGEPQEGERNVKLYQLAVNLRAICDNNKSLLLQIMPRLGLSEEEVRSIVESACKETPKGVSKMMQTILKAKNLSLGPGPSDRLAEENMNRWLWEWGEQIEKLSEHFPLLKDICKGLKRNQYPAALFVAGGLMMTLMTRCTYRFYHRPEELRRLNNSTLIIGDPACGKSFATRLYKLLAGPMIAADQVGKDAINAYRELMRTRGANKEKPKKPKAVIRVHPARTSNAQFIQDMVNAVEEVDGEPMHLHMLTFDTELDNTLAVQKGGSWIDKQTLELKAFHNEEDGQAYSNNDSVMQDFNVFWNYIYTGTPIALKKKVNEQNFGSGLATRLTVIPLPPTKYEMMDREKVVDYESDNRLKAWAEKLDKTKGELSLEKIVDELYDWTARRMMDARDNDSRADEMLLKRCAYHGLNFSAPFIVMRHWEKMHQEGNYWCGEFETDEADWRLAEMLVNIQFLCQRHYFGAMADAYFDNKLKDASVNVQRQHKTFDAFDRLPEEFTIADVMRCFHLSSEASARSKTSRLQRDHLIEKVNDKRGKDVKGTLFCKTNTIML